MDGSARGSAPELGCCPRLPSCPHGLRGLPGSEPLLAGDGACRRLAWNGALSATLLQVCCRSVTPSPFGGEAAAWVCPASPPGIVVYTVIYALHRSKFTPRLFDCVCLQNCAKTAPERAREAEAERPRRPDRAPGPGCQLPRRRYVRRALARRSPRSTGAAVTTSAAVSTAGADACHCHRASLGLCHGR